MGRDDEESGGSSSSSEEHEGIGVVAAGSDPLSAASLSDSSSLTVAEGLARVRALRAALPNQLREVRRSSGEF